jgi:crossover junction endodeoxyribonuclease RuvC
MIVLALDLATVTGFCIGKPGTDFPHYGKVRFGSESCSRKALFGSALRFINETLTTHKPDAVVFEEPLHFGLRRNKSREGNDELAYGLPAIVQAVCFLRGVYDVQQRRTVDVRRFFLGDNPKREIAKRETIGRCVTLGFNVTDDNTADAIALWFYECARIDPRTALRTSPLFMRAIA